MFGLKIGLSILIILFLGFIFIFNCVHGGFAATVLDSATGCAVHTLLKAGESYGTVDLNIKMLKPIPQGKPLLVRAEVVSISKRLGVSQGVLTDGKDIIYAHASCTCMIFRKKENGSLESSLNGNETHKKIKF